MGQHRVNGLEVSNGNTKLGNDTLILNMGDAKTCPSRVRGFCKLGNYCYARKAESMYPGVRAFRARQKAYWLSKSAQEICEDLASLFAKYRKLADRIKYFRYNEAGDFWSQDCVEKLSHIAVFLKNHYGIVTYGYSARKDLDFSKAYFLCKSSGHQNGNNGSTRAIGKTMVSNKKAEHKEKAVENAKTQLKPGEILCPMDCKICNVCKVKNNTDVAFVLH